MALAAGAALAGTAAYLNAKYHIYDDLVALNEQRYTQKLGQRLERENRQSLWYFFENQALRLQDEPCLWYRTQPSDPITRYTWKQTYDQSCRYAQFLLSNGIQPGELVGTYLLNSPEFMFNLLSCWAIGCAPALINHNLSGDGLLHCLKVAHPKILLVDSDPACQQRIEASRSAIEALGMRIVILSPPTLSHISHLLPSRPPNALRQNASGPFPAFVFYTSGTTGFPKACPFQIQRSYVLAHSLLRTTGLRPGPGADVWYDCMPLYHGTGCVVAASCMMSGLTLAIGRRFSVRNFWPDIHASRAAAFVYVGETARYLLAAPESPLDKTHVLKTMYGNGMRPDVWPRFQERFNVPCVNEFFNSTEGMLSLLNVCRGPFHTAHVGHHGGLRRWLYRNAIVPVVIDHGTGAGDGIWRDPRTGFAKRASYEHGGEILIQCAQEADFVGYWGNEKATAAKFERDVFVKGDLFYRTGDALRRDGDGRWQFMDRLGDTFRWKAENVSTAQVAEVLGSFPGVVESNVYGVEVPGHDGRAGCAAVFVPQVVEGEGDGGFDFTALLVHARKGLPRYAVPVFLRLVEKPTPSHNNKLNKVPLRNEGVGLGKIRSGSAGAQDRLYWVKPGADVYTPFEEKDWAGIVGGQVKL